MKQPATLPTLRRQGAALPVLALAVVLAALAGLCFGSQGYTPLRLWQAWCSGDPQNAVYRVLRHVRWPRTLAGLLAGSALAAAAGKTSVGRARGSPSSMWRMAQPDRAGLVYAPQTSVSAQIPAMTCWSLVSTGRARTRSRRAAARSKRLTQL